MPHALRKLEFFLLRNHVPRTRLGLLLLLLLLPRQRRVLLLLL